MTDLIKHSWFKELIDDCKGLVTEAEFESRYILIVAYHTIGSKVEENREKFRKAGIKNISKVVAEAMDRNPRHIQRCVQFYNKYPDLGKLPEGKAISWHKIVNNYLPETTGGRKESKNMIECPKCGFRFEK